MNWPTTENILIQMRNMVSIDECQILYDISINLKPKEILELGIGYGRFTTTLLSACQEFGGHLTSIDNEDRELYSKGLPDLFKALNLDKHWTIIIEDDLKQVKKWKTPIDLLLIDSDHSGEHVHAALNGYAPFMTETGVIVLHDVLHPFHGRDMHKIIINFLMKSQEGRGDGFKPGFEKINAWNYMCLNTWLGMGILYQRTMECGAKHKG